MASELVKNLVDSGIHFGHRVSRWNPKMRPYIFGKRNLIHIIDIRETIKGILRAKRFMSTVVSRGQDILFVGTKRQARNSVIDASAKCGMHYVSERWLGGTLTNFRTIRSRLQRLEELENIETAGMEGLYSKKMISTLSRERKKIKRNLQGIRNMQKLPGALVIVDIKREHNAALEARKLRIPVVALIDTDSDPDMVDIPIPANDDAMRGIELILGELAAAVEEGKRSRTEDPSGGEGGGRAPRPARRSTRAMGRAHEEPPAGEEPQPSEGGSPADAMAST